ncbi:PlsC domain-containing protein, partial [Haematococcus lacustris]
IAPPVDTRQLTDLRDAAGVQALYDDVKHTVERCMGELLVYRDQDEESDLGGRFRRTLGRWTNLVRDTTTGDTASKIRS